MIWHRFGQSLNRIWFAFKRAWIDSDTNCEELERKLEWMWSAFEENKKLTQEHLKRIWNEFEDMWKRQWNEFGENYFGHGFKRSGIACGASLKRTCNEFGQRWSFKNQRPEIYVFQTISLNRKGMWSSQSSRGPKSMLFLIKFLIEMSCGAPEARNRCFS